MNVSDLIGVDEEYDDLLSALLRGHRAAALGNENASSTIVRMTSSVNHSLLSVIAGAFATLGDVHGPADDARWVLYEGTDDQIRMLLDEGKRISGFGNSFYRDKVDPAFEEVCIQIQECHARHWKRMEHVASLIAASRGRVIYPNAAAFTAAVAEIVGLRDGEALLLFLIGRIPSWCVLRRQVRGL